MPELEAVARALLEQYTDPACDQRDGAGMNMNPETPESTSPSAQNPAGICGIVICPCTVPQMVRHQCEEFGRGRSSSGNCGKTLPANWRL